VGRVILGAVIVVLVCAWLAAIWIMFTDPQELFRKWRWKFTDASIVLTHRCSNGAPPPDRRIAGCPSLSATHRLANFQFEASDLLLNWPRDEQNCKHKRDSATGYSEDHNVMVCKKHGVPSDALLRGVLVP
jgi:hypothetical protein